MRTRRSSSRGRCRSGARKRDPLPHRQAVRGQTHTTRKRLVRHVPVDHVLVANERIELLRRSHEIGRIGCDSQPCEPVGQRQLGRVSEHLHLPLRRHHAIGQVRPGEIQREHCVRASPRVGPTRQQVLSPPVRRGRRSRLGAPPARPPAGTPGQLRPSSQRRRKPNTDDRVKTQHR